MYTKPSFQKLIQALWDLINLSINPQKSMIHKGMTILEKDSIYKNFKGDSGLKQVLLVCIV